MESQPPATARASDESRAGLRYSMAAALVQSILSIKWLSEFGSQGGEKSNSPKIPHVPKKHQ